MSKSINPIGVLGISPDNSNLTMEDGQPLWPPGSLVHLKTAAYLALTEDVLQQVVFGSSSDANGQPGKRPRLDSVLGRSKTAATATAVVVKPGLSAGVLPSGSSGGRGGNWGSK